MTMSTAFAFKQFDAYRACNSLRNARALVRAIRYTCPDFDTYLSEPDAGIVRCAFRLVEREGESSGVAV